MSALQALSRRSSLLLSGRPALSRLLPLLPLCACGGVLDSGAGEAFRVQEGVFFTGALPEDPAAETPLIVYAAGVTYVATQGQGSVGYRGLTSADAWSVAVQFVGASTGYWVVPVDGPDVTQDNGMLFDLTIDFGRDLPYGLQTLAFTAIDGNGQPGPRYEAQICVLPDVSDHSFTACDPEIPPQDTVLSLEWDTDVDLDLVVVTPAGKIVNAASPSTALPVDPEAEEPAEPEEIGELSRDSNAGCLIDGFRLESLIFAGPPPAGDYEVYASLNSACGAAYVNFDLTLYRSVTLEEGGEVTGYEVEASELLHGTLLAAQADGGAGLGTHLLTLTLP